MFFSDDIHYIFNWVSQEELFDFELFIRVNFSDDLINSQELNKFNSFIIVYFCLFLFMNESKIHRTIFQRG